MLILLEVFFASLMALAASKTSITPSRLVGDFVITMFCLLGRAFPIESKVDLPMIIAVFRVFF